MTDEPMEIAPTSPNHSLPSPVRVVDDDLRLLASSPQFRNMASSQLDAQSARYSSLVAFICSNNAPDAARAALKTISTILTNILTFPKDSKYRTIKTANKVYANKVAGVEGADDLLACMGFERVEGAEDALVLPMSVRVLDLSSLQMLLNQKLYEEGGEIIDGGVEASTATVAAQPAVVEFDPYQPSIFRTAIQPRGERSLTETRLEELQRKQKQLEGAVPEDLDAFRSTQVRFVSAMRCAGCESVYV